MTNELDLNTIATEINGEHAACFEAARATLAHAIRAGELLQQAKELLKHGEWAPWLAENCEFSARTARNYMRLAEHKNELAKRQDNAILTVSGALALLAEHTPQAESEPDRWARELQDLDKRLDQTNDLPELGEIITQAGAIQTAAAEYRLRAGRKMGEFLNVGAALDQIQREKLYRGSYETFEAYCKDRYGYDNIPELLEVWREATGVKQ